MELEFNRIRYFTIIWEKFCSGLTIMVKDSKKNAKIPGSFATNIYLNPSMKVHLYYNIISCHFTYDTKTLLKQKGKQIE